MKRISIIFLVLSLVLNSCSPKILTNHPSLKSSGIKSNKESQKKLAKFAGGPNYKKPNKFKEKHF